MNDIVFDEEIVVCEKELRTTYSKKKYFRLAIVGLVVLILAIVGSIIGGIAMGGGPFGIFKYPDHWLSIVGIVAMAIGLIMFVFFLILYLMSKKSSVSKCILTNKRIAFVYYDTSDNLISSESLLLEYITNYSVLNNEAKYVLTVATETKSVSFVLEDTEMYDALAKIIRAYK